MHRVVRTGPGQYSLGLGSLTHGLIMGAVRGAVVLLVGRDGCELRGWSRTRPFHRCMFCELCLLSGQRLPRPPRTPALACACGPVRRDARGRGGAGASFAFASTDGDGERKNSVISLPLRSETPRARPDRGLVARGGEDNAPTYHPTTPLHTSLLYIYDLVHMFIYVLPQCNELRCGELSADFTRALAYT